MKTFLPINTSSIAFLFLFIAAMEGQQICGFEKHKLIEEVQSSFLLFIGFQGILFRQLLKTGKVSFLTHFTEVLRSNDVIFTNNSIKSVVNKRFIFGSTVIYKL